MSNRIFFLHEVENLQINQFAFHFKMLFFRYELIKTEDLPKLNKDAMFDETSVMKVAKNILAFLKQNATKEGHTYWLFKAKDEDIGKKI